MLPRADFRHIFKAVRHIFLFFMHTDAAWTYIYGKLKIDLA